MKTKRLTRGEAIRAFCIECMGGDARLPRDCTVTRCALWIYRNGVEEAVPALDDRRQLVLPVDDNYFFPFADASPPIGAPALRFLATSVR